MTQTKTPPATLRDVIRAIETKRKVTLAAKEPAQ